jgi:hypothetical protein
MALNPSQHERNKETQQRAKWPAKSKSDRDCEDVDQHFHGIKSVLDRMDAAASHVAARAS